MVAETYFRVFDTAFSTEEKAIVLLNGWEHKEDVHKIFVVLDTPRNKPLEINLIENDYPYYCTLCLAAEHIREENELAEMTV